LPLDRIDRVLQLLQQGKPVSRGTLQTVFLQKPYDELRRLGLLAETEAEARAANAKGTGMLTVSEVIPTSPADDELQAGDILLRVDGEDRKSTRLNSSHVKISYAVFCLKKK